MIIQICLNSTVAEQSTVRGLLLYSTTYVLIRAYQDKLLTLKWSK